MPTLLVNRHTVNGKGKVMKDWLNRNWATIAILPGFLTVMVLAAGLIVALTDSSPTPRNGNGNRITVASPVKDSQGIGTREPYLLFMRDCGDVETFPCVTYDENEWRMVTEYAPNYRYVKLYKCANEGGGKNLPCVYVSKNRRDLSPYYVYTRTITLH